jgi:hypothetical protein
MAVLGILLVAFLVAKPVVRATKAWQARRLAEEALVLLDQKDWNQAAKKTQAAFQLRPSEPAAWHAAAVLYSRTGQPNEAFPCWQNFASSHALSTADRRDYATAALAANELELAAAQIDRLLTQGASAPPDLILAAQLATLRGDSSSAVRYSKRVLDNKEADAGDSFSAIVTSLVNAAPRSTAYAETVNRLIVLARDDRNPASLPALELLARRPLRPRLTEIGTPPLTIAAPGDRSDFISRKELADRLERHANARAYDRLLALSSRTQDEPDRADEYVARAIEIFRNGDDETLAVLLGWLYEQGRFAKILELLPPDHAARKHGLFQVRVDALAAAGRYPELQKMLLDENSPLDPLWQHLLLAVVRSKMGEALASENEWQRAMQTANTTQKFLVIAQFAERNGNPEIADRACREVLRTQPRSRLVYLARLRLAEASGQTGRAREIAAEILRLWPEDMATSVRDIYLHLLLGVSRDEAAALEAKLSDLAARNSGGPTASAVLALARLRTGQPAAALGAFEGRPLSSPADISAVHAAVLAANGWKAEARAEARKLLTVKLLPEERALIAPLLDD